MPNQPPVDKNVGMKIDSAQNLDAVFAAVKTGE
jgi:hypothetical protein